VDGALSQRPGDLRVRRRPERLSDDRHEVTREACEGLSLERMEKQLAIEGKVRAAFAPLVLEVINESKNHSVPPGSETHFKLVVVSRAFEGVGRVERHRLVHAALAELLAGGVHALTITARTPAEWATAEGAVVAASPPCLGGSKGGPISGA